MKSKNSKKSKKELEKIKEQFKKLKVKIPEIKKQEEKKKEESKKDESTLEEQVEETEEEIEDTEFHEFFRPSERSFTSLLDKIEPIPENLEQNVALTPIKQEDENKTPMTYSPDEDYATGQSSKYQTENLSSRRIDTSHHDLQRQELRNQFQQQSKDSWNPWNQKVDVQAVEETRSLPFEKEDKKYREFKPHR